MPAIPNPSVVGEPRGPKTANWSRQAAWSAITAAATLGAAAGYSTPLLTPNPQAEVAAYEAALRLYKTEADIAYQMQLSVDGLSDQFPSTTETQLDRQRQRVQKALDLAEQCRPQAIQR
jgi:hypothetical protein